MGSSRLSTSRKGRIGSWTYVVANSVKRPVLVVRLRPVLKLNLNEIVDFIFYFNIQAIHN